MSTTSPRHVGLPGEWRVACPPPTPRDPANNPSIEHCDFYFEPISRPIIWTVWQTTCSLSLKLGSRVAGQGGRWGSQSGNAGGDSCACWGSSALASSPLWLSCKEPACSAGDLGSTPGLGRSPGEGKGYPLQYSGLHSSWDCEELDTTERLSFSHLHPHPQLSIYPVQPDHLFLLLIVAFTEACIVAITSKVLYPLLRLP